MASGELVGEPVQIWKDGFENELGGCTIPVNVKVGHCAFSVENDRHRKQRIETSRVSATVRNAPAKEDRCEIAQLARIT